MSEINTFGRKMTYTMKRYAFIVATLLVLLPAYGGNDGIPVVHYTPFGYEDKVREAVKQDSVFHLVLYPYRVSSFSYIGVMCGGNILYYDKEGNKYMSIAELVKAEGLSIKEYIDIYADCYRQRMLKNCESSLYSMDMEEAKSIVRDSYFYHWMKSRDREATISEFCELVKEWLPETDVEKLNRMLYSQITVTEKEGDVFINLNTAGNYIPLCGANVYSIMAIFYSPEAMDILYDQFSIYQTRFRTALNIIRKMRNTEASLTAYFNELIVVSDYDLMKYLIDNE